MRKDGKLLTGLESLEHKCIMNSIQDFWDILLEQFEKNKF